MLFAFTTLEAVTVYLFTDGRHACYLKTAAVAAFDDLIAHCRRLGSYPSVPAGTDFRHDQDGI